ncbi:uncharacterized protein LOC130453618 [Monodelphis domestica]|uniref:uncharacterized protein LOC130453618 n=1 Tax=Monodelphis domestica TaxID=13616 RepID=UPI0024E260A2|nr:uncharacterized protein LOC130453618 [Monodelphis domestica]
MDDSPFQIEIGREPPEVKSELIELLELSEERKKYFMDSLIVQEKIGDITIVRGQASICRSPRVPWFWMASDLKFVIGVLKILIEEDQGCRKDFQAIFEQANIFQDNYKDMNTYNVNMEQKPDESDKEGTFLPLAPEEEFLLGQFKIKPKEIKNEDLSPEQLLAQGDFNSGEKNEAQRRYSDSYLPSCNFMASGSKMKNIETPIKKEKEEDEIVVEEEIISTGKPTEGKAKKRFSWFRNIKERKLWNFFHFKKHDKQVKNVHKWEEIDQEVLKDYCPYSTEAPKTLPTEWTNIEVGNWLWSIGMEEYVVKFYCKGISGEKLLTLDNRSLKEIEVNKKKDRRKILKAIKKVRDFWEKNHHFVLL